jgi:WhiB family transcriptional regulator, redox-sensing transcriptional regulator
VLAHQELLKKRCIGDDSFRVLIGGAEERSLSGGSAGSVASARWGSWGRVREKMDTSWMALGTCRTERPAVFFPSDGVGVDVARRVCGSCVVKEPCLEYALAERIDHGVWGGASERERRRILKSRRVRVTVGI